MLFMINDHSTSINHGNGGNDGSSVSRARPRRRWYPRRLMGRQGNSGLMSAALGILVAISIAGAAAHAGGKLQGSSSEDGNWPSYGRTQAATHFRPPARIDRSNVQRLGLAWWLDLPIVGRPGVPLAVDGVLFFSNAFSEIEAVDAAAGLRPWRFD